MWLHIARASVLIGISAAWSPLGAQDCLSGEEAWGETVIRTQGIREEDGLTPEQRAAVRKAGVQTFAVPSELPEDISLAAVGGWSYSEPAAALRAAPVQRGGRNLWRPAVFVRVRQLPVRRCESRSGKLQHSYEFRGLWTKDP